MHFFPPLYPDELLYSALARYHVYSGNVSSKKTMRDLFGSMSVCAVVDLPCHLESLSNRILGGAISKEVLLYKHTLFPYYSTFLPDKHRKSVINEMYYNDGQAVHMKIGLTASAVKNNRALKFCPSCIVYDRQHFGVCYWHRAHQLPGINMCHKHSVLLINSDVSFASRRNKHEYVSLEDRAAQENYEAIKSISNHDLFIAQQTYRLLNVVSIKSDSQDLFKNEYCNQLNKLNLLTCGGRIKYKELIPHFSSFYGEKLLTQLYSTIDTKSQDTWIHKVLRHEDYVCHPLRHILLHGFFGIEIGTNIKNNDHSNRLTPFGDQNWPCLNKVADHYMKNVITSCEITRCSDTGKPVGTFTCSCGFIYSCRGPDVVEEDKTKIGRIKQFGEVWTGKLLELSKDNNVSLREAARHLGVDPKTVKRQLSNLKQNHVKVDSITEENILKKRNQRLEIWDSNNVIKSVLEAKSKQVLRVNWEQRDKELVNKVRETVEYLKPNRKVKISKTEIGRQTGNLSLINNRLEKLPMTKSLLNQVVESTEQFQLRRIHLVTNEMGICVIVKPWLVTRQAGLRGKSNLSKVKKLLKAIE